MKVMEIHARLIVRLLRVILTLLLGVTEQNSSFRILYGNAWRFLFALTLTCTSRNLPTSEQVRPQRCWLERTWCLEVDVQGLIACLSGQGKWGSGADDLFVSIFIYIHVFQLLS
jgi:hypothetical protein